MVERRNKETGVLEVQVPAIITEIRSEVFTLNNEKLTPYKLGTTKINYPDGGEEEVLTRFYTKSIMAHPEVFKTGERINLVIQTEGMYAGRAVAQLPGSTVDVSRLLGKNTSKEIALTNTTTQIVKDQVVEEDLVV